MKNRILTFIIGILCGSIITTLGFMIYIKGIQRQKPIYDENHGMHHQMGNPPEKPNGEMKINPLDGMQNQYKK